MKVFVASALSRKEINEAFVWYVENYPPENELLSCGRYNRQPQQRMEEDSGKYPPHLENQCIYIAGEHPVKNGSQAIWEDVNILESFYYLQDNKYFPKLLPRMKHFLLDSGAFTFMQSGKKVDWDEYTERYANFINKYDIKDFFELDIDSIVGIEEVERLRAKLEMLTNKHPIVVWHKSRGLDYFKTMCEKYKYVALGGIASKEIKTNDYEKLFPFFIDYAHKRGCKIHGLGYSRTNKLRKYHFDSVDSTSWLAGNKGGFLYKFNPLNGIIEQVHNDQGCRMKSRETALHNFEQFVKFSNYAEKYY